MIKKILPIAGLVLCAALALLFLTLGVLELIPAPTSTLTVEETFAVSSSKKTADKEQPVYVCQLTGTLFNPTSEELTVELILRVDSPGGAHTSVTNIASSIPARASREILHEWESTVPYDRVTEISVRDKYGNVTELRNREGIGLSPAIFGVLMLLFGLLAAYCGKQMLYAAEETRALRAATDENGAA